MNSEKCPFCKAKGRLSPQMPLREYWIQCHVCGAQGPRAKDSIQAWTRWRWAWEDEEGKSEPTNLLRERVNTELLKTIDRRLGDMQESLDRIALAIKSPKGLLGADWREFLSEPVPDKDLLSKEEEKTDPDNWLANHPRIRELSDEIDRLRKELYVQTGQTPGDQS